MARHFIKPSLGEKQSTQTKYANEVRKQSTQTNYANVVHRSSTQIELYFTEKLAAAVK